MDRPTLRPFWRVAVGKDEIARRYCAGRPRLRRRLELLLKTPEGRERVRGILARRLGVPADRLTLRSGGVVAGDVWLEVPVGDGWVAASRLAIQEGRLVVAELRVFPEEKTALRRENPPGRWSGEVLGVSAVVPRGGLTARKLYRVRLGEHPRHLRDIIKFVREKLGAEAFEPGGSLAALGFAPTTERPRPRREFGRLDSFYAELAREYVRLVEGGSQRPNAEIAARRRKPVPTITGWLHEARVRGLLTPGAQGKSGGRLTPFAERVLREASRSPVHRTSTEKGVSKTRHQVGAFNRRGKKTKRRKR